MENISHKYDDIMNLPTMFQKSTHKYRFMTVQHNFHRLQLLRDTKRQLMKPPV